LDDYAGEGDGDGGFGCGGRDGGVVRVWDFADDGAVGGVAVMMEESVE